MPCKCKSGARRNSGVGNSWEEYELLGLLHELQRQEYLKRHLTKVLPLLAEMEQLKEKVKLNGHFKNLSSLDFEL